MLEALEGQVRARRPFVLVVGASGSGKSSLVRAGVLPLLTQPEAIEGVGLWRWSVTRPGAGGSGGALAAALLEPPAIPVGNEIHATGTWSFDVKSSMGGTGDASGLWSWVIVREGDTRKIRSETLSSNVGQVSFGPRQITGCWSVIRVGDDWKIRMLTSNSTPGLAISFALPTFAQQKNTPDPQLRQKLVDVIAKHVGAQKRNDAAATAACFTQDAVYVTARGPVNGQEAIEKWYADLSKAIKNSDQIITIDQDSPHVIGTAGNEIWATGGWSATVKGENFGPLQIKGYWSVIRVGDDWKIQMLIDNQTPQN